MPHTNLITRTPDMTPEPEQTISITAVLGFFRDWYWAPLMALIGWAWNRNESTHEKLQETCKSLSDAHSQLRQDTSEGHSSLHNRIVEHVDMRIEATVALMREEDNRNRDNIGKLYDKIEESRRDTASALATHAQRSEDRHRELMMALHEGLNQKADK